MIEDLFFDVGIIFDSKHGKHFLKFIKADEFMLAVEEIDAGKAAESFSIALRINADHDKLLPLMLDSLMAEVLVIIESHVIKDLFLNRVRNKK